MNEITCRNCIIEIVVIYKSSIIMLKILYKLPCTIKVRKNVWFQPFQRCSTIVKRTVENNIETKWFAEKEKEILQVVNAGTLKELLKYIEPMYATTIISNRKSGHYKSLNDILSKNELNSDVLNQFYTSIIENKMQKKKFKKFIVTPDIKTIEMPKTMLGVHVGPTAITWTLLSSDFKVLDWDCLVWYSGSSKINSFDLTNVVSFVAASLPLSSCYVIEEFRIANKFRHISLTQQQITIAITSCLKVMENHNRDVLSQSKNNVYMMQPLMAARFFNLVIGNEVIATEYITKLILNNDVTSNKGLKDIHVDQALKEKYTQKTIEQQEQIGWSLLKVITFAHLIRTFSTNIVYKQSV